MACGEECEKSQFITKALVVPCGETQTGWKLTQVGQTSGFVGGKPCSPPPHTHMACPFRSVPAVWMLLKGPCVSVDLTLALLETVESFRGGTCKSSRVIGDVLLGETVEDTSLLHDWTIMWTIVPP